MCNADTPLAVSWTNRRAPANPPSSIYGVVVPDATPRRIPCVGGIVLDDGPHGRRLLLVRRGQEPAKGTWSVPGGRVEPDESAEAATAREVLEETGLDVRVGALVGTVERDAPGGGVYVIEDRECVPAPGAEPGAVRAGDDAVDAGWFTAAELPGLRCAPGLVEALTAWGVLSRLR
jgi:ADP-ribose pyrophosphatase YjhB (NUDIX family)